MQLSTRTRYALLAGVMCCVLVGGSLWYRAYAPSADFTIEDFDYDRDAKDVLAGIEPERYWLFGDPDYSAEFMLKYRARQQDIMTAGQLIIKVARDHGKYVGFTACYMKPGNIGHILFVNVVPAFRGKGNVEKLLSYAISEFRSQGAVAVQLLTRTDNTRARRVYERYGFKLVDSIEGYEPQEGYVYFDYPL